MDRISLLGLGFGLLAIVGGQVLEGGQLASLLQPTAFLIVVGGTLGAVMLQSRRSSFIEGLRMVRWVLLPPPAQPLRVIDEVSLWARIARKDGLLVLEGQVAGLHDPFRRKGLQLLVDGLDPQRLREVLEIENDSWEQRVRQAARIWDAAGGYAPTIGILGAVMGLIQVMENLSDPALLGTGIAVAFVATIYGVGLANLVFLPIGKKLASHIQQLVDEREMFIDGLVGIANGENPRVIASRMESYLG